LRYRRDDIVEPVQAAQEVMLEARLEF